MGIVFIILLTVIMLFILYILSLRGRIGFADWSHFSGYYYAHRGLHNKSDAPENSISAFKKAKEKGYGVELDVHLLKDGALAVIHDFSLLRTAGVDIKIEDLESKELKNYFLEGTDETVPLFSNVLKLFDGKVPLIIEIKSDGKNINKLCSAVAKELENYKGKYCIESFDPRCVYWFKRNKPNVIRGQLSENYFKSGASNLPAFLKLIMTGLFTNFLNKPDFIAYRFSDREAFSFKVCLKLWKMQGVCWTVTQKDEIDLIKRKNIFPIFENVNP